MQVLDEIKYLEIYEDSILIILQVSDKWTIRSPELVKYQPCTLETYLNLFRHIYTKKQEAVCRGSSYFALNAKIP